LEGPVTFVGFIEPGTASTATLMPARQKSALRASCHRQLTNPTLQEKSADTKSKCLRNLPLDHQRDGLHFPV
jgi:hypothetical protein